MMNKVIEKPHLIFWISIPIIILSGLLNLKETLSFNVHDTYFVLSPIDLSILISILFGIIGFGYWIMLKTNKKLSRLLNFIHILSTIGGVLLLWSLIQFFRETYEYNYTLTMIIYVIIIIVILGQIIYPINIIKGLIKK